MEDCATSGLRFETPTNLALEVAFDGGRLTSDGGLAWLAKIDEELGLCETGARHVPQWRKGKVRHSLWALIRQRVFQIACGYEDQNDADTLRADPLLKLVCGSLSERGSDLASPPSRALRTRRMPGSVTERPKHSSSCTWADGGKMAL